MDGPAVYGAAVPADGARGGELAAGANVVVNASPPALENHDVPWALQERCPATPVIAEGRRDEAERYAGAPGGLPGLPFSVTTGRAAVGGP